MKNLLIFLTILISISSMGQNNLEQKVLGSWLLKRNSIGEHSIDTNRWKIIISYYEDGQFQKYYIDQEADILMAVEAGLWKINKLSKELILSNRHSIPHSYRNIKDDKRRMIEIITDSSLIFKKDNEETNTELNYTRTISYAKMWDRYIPITRNKFKINKDLYLVDNSDKSKSIKLSSKRECVFSITDPFLDTNIYSSKSMTIEGNLVNFFDSIVVVYPSYQNSYILCKDGSQISTDKFFKGDSVENISINSNDLLCLSYYTKTSDAFDRISASLLISSILTALVVAPLVSIDYKTNEINSTRYLKWAGYGLIGVGVSIPLSALHKRKDYNISNKISVKRNKQWHFELK